MNKRNDFRAEFNNTMCELYEGANRQTAKVKDISGSGMSLYVFPDRFGKYIMVRFNIGGQNFFRKAEVARKSLLGTGEYEFGLKFRDQSEEQRVALHSVLTSYEGKRSS